MHTAGTRAPFWSFPPTVRALLSLRSELDFCLFTNDCGWLKLSEACRFMDGIIAAVARKVVDIWDASPVVQRVSEGSCCTSRAGRRFTRLSFRCARQIAFSRNLLSAFGMYPQLASSASNDLKHAALKY